MEIKYGMHYVSYTILYKDAAEFAADLPNWHLAGWSFSQTDTYDGGKVREPNSPVAISYQWHTDVKGEYPPTVVARRRAAQAKFDTNPQGLG